MPGTSAGKPSVNKNRRRLGRYFAVTLAALIVALNALEITLISLQMHKSIGKDNESSSVQMAQAYALAASDKIGQYFLDLQIYSLSDACYSGDPAAIRQYIMTHQRVRSADLESVMYCGKDGIGYIDNGQSVDVSHDDVYKAIVQDGKSNYIGNPFFSPETGRPSVYVAQAIVRDNENIGFIAGLANIGPLQKSVDKLSLWGSGYAFMISGDGTVVAHAKTEYELKKNFITGLSKGHEDMIPVAKAMTSGKSGFAWLNGPKGGKDLIAYSGIAGTDWGIAFSSTSADIYALSAHLESAMTIMAVIMLAVLLLCSTILINRSMKPLATVEKTIGDIASGNADLTKRIAIKTNDEVGSIGDGFNQFVGKLQSIMTELKESKNALVDAGEKLNIGAEDTAASITQILANIQSMSDHITNQSAGVEETAGAVNEIASNIASLEKMIETQAAGVTQASAAVEEMIGNINAVDGSVEKLASSFEVLQKRAQEGSDKQNDVNERIKQVEDQSAMLEEANSAIANIASQTNLLAMNAAIEAAHAGEAGKGFSVVADEIRKLSETSSIQSKTIGEELTKIEETISSIVSASVESSEVFNAVASGIKDTDELVRQIKEAMLEQNEGSKQISEALSSMNNSTAEVRTASAEMSAGNKAILDEVKNLQDATISMKDSMGEMGAGAGKINETGTALREIAVQMKNTIAKIGDQVDRFKV